LQELQQYRNTNLPQHVQGASIALHVAHTQHHVSCAGRAASNPQAQLYSEIMRHVSLPLGLLLQQYVWVMLAVWYCKLLQLLCCCLLFHP
jgi:hypothetical protein